MARIAMTLAEELEILRLRQEESPLPMCKVTIGVEFLGEYVETEDEIEWHNICDGIYDLSADVEVEVRELAEKRLKIKAALKKGAKNEPDRLPMET
jgi:hypothetical protein